MTGHVTLEIPVVEVEVKNSGASEKAFEMRGFALARWQDGDVQHISNPLIEWAHTGPNPAAVHATNNLSNVKLYIKLVPANIGSNPGQDDEQASIVYDHYRL